MYYKTGEVLSITFKDNKIHGKGWFNQQDVVSNNNKQGQESFAMEIS